MSGCWARAATPKVDVLLGEARLLNASSGQGGVTDLTSWRSMFPAWKLECFSLRLWACSVARSGCIAWICRWPECTRISVSCEVNTAVKPWIIPSQIKYLAQGFISDSKLNISWILQLRHWPGPCLPCSVCPAIKSSAITCQYPSSNVSMRVRSQESIPIKIQFLD